MKFTLPAALLGALFAVTAGGNSEAQSSAPTRTSKEDDMERARRLADKPMRMVIEAASAPTGKRAPLALPALPALSEPRKPHAPGPVSTKREAAPSTVAGPNSAPQTGAQPPTPRAAAAARAPASPVATAAPPARAPVASPAPVVLPVPVVLPPEQPRAASEAEMPPGAPQLVLQSPPQIDDDLPWPANGRAHFEVEVLIQPDGSVSQAQILSTNAPSLSRQVGRSVRSWKFAPLPHETRHLLSLELLRD